MAITDVLVFTSRLTCGEAERRLARLPETSPLVIVLDHSGHRGYHRFSVAEVLRAASHRTQDADLAEALGLHGLRSASVRQLADIRNGPRSTSETVLLDGDIVLGIFRDDSGTDEWGLDIGFEGPSGGGDWNSSDGWAASLPDAGFDGFDDFGPQTGLAGGGDPGETVDGDGPENTDSVAYPLLTAPAAVVVGEVFTLTVGLRSQATAGVEESAFVIPNAPESFTLLIQVLGFGFSFPHVVRQEVSFRRDDLGSASADFLVIADPVTTDSVRRLEVSFEYMGNLCGRAWRELTVGPLDVPQAVSTKVGGTGVTPPPADQAPHLTIQIASRQAEAKLQWRMESKYNDLVIPSGDVTNRLDQGSSKEFAVFIMAEMPAQQGSPLMENAVEGIGKLISQAIPVPVWNVINDVWQRARVEGEVPSLLLVTEEPFIPWELAWLNGDYVDPSLLPGPRPLGSLWQIGRWIPPRATPRGGDRPPFPPATVIDVDMMALVVGDYASASGLRALPEAIKEGDDLAASYQSFKMQATEFDVKRLLDNRVFAEDGNLMTPSAVHIAAHGEVDQASPQYSGIILSDSLRRLDAATVLGSPLCRVARPFVFLNACQVGTASLVLSDYGGLASAFVSEGCRGFVAPLWNVDDGVAHDFAVAFYQRTVTDQQPVAQALMELRGWFGTDMAVKSATPLAYVFYGHPRLMLS